MGLAIVAIPEQGDRTYKISSEKVPHCILLFLGDADKANIPEITSFLEHAVDFSDIGPFGLEVERRGKLGEDEADVLFFHKRWSGKRLEQFRGQLLQNRHVKDAYDSTEQFDGWTPHLTLGYPRAPARKDDRDWPIGYVHFDKIALWTGDYSGPEFELSYDYNDDLAEVAMSLQAERGRDFLEHYGVKGMKWGVRNRSASAEKARAEAFTNRGIRGNKTKIKTKGGRGQDAADDAVKAALAKQTLKTSGAKALSNKDLQDFIQRENLERQATELAAPKGKKFVQKTLGNTGKQQVQNVVNQEASRAVGEAMKKRK